MPEPDQASYEVTVSLASRDDLNTLHRLFVLMKADQELARGGYLWAKHELRQEPVVDSLVASLESDEQWLWLASLDDVPLGFAGLELLHLPDGEVLGRLRELFVVAEARSVGLGEALMDCVEDLCRDQGCSGIESAVLPGNRASKNFMESRGLKARLIRVHREL